MNIPDYNEQYERYQAEQYRELRKLPKCAACDEHVTDDHFYLINDEVICPYCLEADYRKNTDDYVE